jgi:hypothetical protein
LQHGHELYNDKTMKKKLDLFFEEELGDGNVGYFDEII